MFLGNVLPIIGSIASGIVGGIFRSGQQRRERRAQDRAATLSFERQNVLDRNRTKNEWWLRQNVGNMENTQARRMVGLAGQQERFTIGASSRASRNEMRDQFGYEDQAARRDFGFRTQESDQRYQQQRGLAQQAADLEEGLRVQASNRAMAAFRGAGQGSFRRR